MCDTLAELRGGLCRYAAGFEPELLSGDDATKVMEEASAIESVAATLKALAATRVAATSQWRREGDASAAHHMARKTGTTVGQASEALKRAERLKNLPAADAAARRGELSSEQVSAIADAATADPRAEEKLVDSAKSSTLRELRDQAARTKAAAEGEDVEARRRRNHARRSLRDWTDAEGVWNLHCRNNPEVGARIMAVLNAKRNEIFRHARSEGRRESSEAYGADALAEVIEAYGAGGLKPSGTDESPFTDATAGGGEPSHEGKPSGSGAAKGPTRPKIIVRIDLWALLRGRPLGDEVCEIAGFGPVAVSVVREMIESQNPFLAALATEGVKVTGVAHLRRRPSAFQQTALEWLYPTCAAQGCSATAGLQNDHRDDWAKTHVTSFDLLDRLCARDHRLKTLEGWSLVEGMGKRPFVAPSDPRHPNNATSTAHERPPPAVNNSPPEAA